jgi:hypothetical protein
MAINIYDIGDTVVISAEFRNPDTDALVDPPQVFGSFIDPSLNQTDYTYTVDVELVRDGIGEYHYNIVADEAGTWQYKIYATGVAQQWLTFLVREDVVVPTPVPAVAESSCVAVPLWRYAQRIQYPECQFYGVRNDATLIDYQCKEMWSKEERDTIDFYLREAQQEVEDELGYFLCPTWVYGRMQDVPNGDDRLVDTGHLGWEYVTRWSMVIEGGILATTLIGNGSAVDHTTDPALVALTTTVTDTDEIRVFHPGSAIEIYPSAMDISGGILSIYIPRCRMVLESLLETPPNGLDYANTSNFEASVDVYRFYNDPSTNATLVSPHTCTPTCLSQGCGEYTQAACIYVTEQRIGSISLRPATYTGGAWVAAGLTCSNPSRVRLNYRAGMLRVSRKIEDAVIRLAHTKMPNEPCGCDYAQRMWKRDRNIPQVVTEQRANNPFGLMDGAWIAWNFIQSSKKVEMDII